MCTTIGYGYPSCTLWSMIILLLMFVDNCLPLVTPRRMYTYQNGNTFFPPPSRLHLASANGDHSKDSPSSIVIDETKRASRSRTRSTTTMFTAPVCRIVSRADSRLPTSCSMLPPFLCQSPHLWDQLDAFYHAQARQRTKSLRYLERTTTTNNNNNSNNRTEETRLLSTTRDALEDAGFELLSRRDLDLCESLNAAYLLRLSIVPDVKELDAGIAQEFYPERFHSNGTAMDTNELLFDGRVLVYWRGYSDEVTKGRLILPKLDYLQASLVQRSAAWLKQRLDEVESQFVKSILQQTRAWKRNVRAMIVAAVDSVPVQTFAQAIRDLFLDESEMKPFMVGDDLEEEEDGGNDSSSSSSSKKSGRFKLGRYGGSKIRFAGSPNPSDALNPFMICEMNYKDPVPCPNGHDGYIQQLGWNSEQDTISNAVHDMYEEVNHQAFTCEYDAKMVSKNQELPRMQLLERVTLSNLVDVFTTSGRRTLLKAIFSESELLEPRYEEVVVIWRPLIKQKPVYYPPKFVSEFCDMFDIEGFEPPPKDKPEPPLESLEIRNFERVPMSNLPAVFPKTRLIFRPADAFLFDMISFVTFALVLSSIRLDSPKLDLLALVSVSLWTLRTFFRYSNKLARYDLLVKKFLTSKLSHRNAGALKYLNSEAASQRAVRAALVQSCVSHCFKSAQSPFQGETADITTTSSEQGSARATLKNTCMDDVNKLLINDKVVQINVDRALSDLEDLGIVQFSRHDEELLLHVKDALESNELVKQSWVDLLDVGRIPTKTYL